jgi:uncharacterized protein (DUF488 family)
MNIFTIGHSNQTIEEFISLLHKYGVTALADVRSHPHSRYLPHFNQANLKESLINQGVRYVFLGHELGARSDNLDCYIEGKAIYERIAKTEAFHQGIQRVLEGTQKYKVALMCAEKDPITCHRAILICQHLKKFGLNINHILRNGNLESHLHLENRMLVKQKLTEFSEGSVQVQLTLFETNLPTREQCLQQAYVLQGREIAYVEKDESRYEKSDQTVHDWVY